MSLFSQFLRRSFGVPEVSLNKVAVRRANQELDRHKKHLIAAIDAEAARMRQRVPEGITKEEIRGLLHDVVDGARIPAYLKIPTSVLIDSLDFDQYLGASNAGREIERLRQYLSEKIGGMRL